MKNTSIIWSKTLICFAEWGVEESRLFSVLQLLHLLCPWGMDAPWTGWLVLIFLLLGGHSYWIRFFERGALDLFYWWPKWRQYWLLGYVIKGLSVHTQRSREAIAGRGTHVAPCRHSSQDHHRRAVTASVAHLHRPEEHRGRQGNQNYRLRETDALFGSSRGCTGVASALWSRVDIYQDEAFQSTPQTEGGLPPGVWGHIIECRGRAFHYYTRLTGGLGQGPKGE